MCLTYLVSPTSLIVLQEFLDQTEKELLHDIPISFKVDTTVKGIANSQIGFIRFIVLPL